ncbi:MAG: substrate-binding domain-containing protein [Burkholderiales bacterium]|nr:substrate-binding domain-containing protein [Burkholderiales bacterium]
MATRQVLSELASAYERLADCRVAIESVGGVDAAKRVTAGEVFDVVVLASDAIAKLASAGHVQAGSQVDLVRSGVAVAVQAGAVLPDISSEDAVRRTVLAARSVSYSTGPSGVALLALFDRWGITEQIKSRLVQAPAGVPVGSLVAKGDVELGFQQYSELMSLPGITVIGPLPPAIQIVTTFTAAVGTGAPQPDAARALLAYMSSAQAAATIRRHGMEPAS